MLIPPLFDVILAVFMRRKKGFFLALPLNSSSSKFWFIFEIEKSEVVGFCKLWVNKDIDVCRYHVLSFSDV